MNADRDTRRFTTASDAPAPEAATPAAVAQVVERRTENPGVGGSTPPCGTLWTPFDIDEYVKAQRIWGRLRQMGVLGPFGNRLPGIVGSTSLMTVIDDFAVFPSSRHEVEREFAGEPRSVTRP